mgnify:CR=1 FL=1
MKQTEIAERKVWLHQTTERPEWVIIQPVDEHDQQGLDEEIDWLSSHSTVSYTLVAFRINDWNVELSPWKAPAVFGSEDFGEGASKTLCYVLDELIPRFKGNRYCLGGYSLAGLFALWAGYQTERFEGIAAASPSVWYPQWIDYASENRPFAKSIYLSLGDKEEKAKNPVMAQVGNAIRKQHELLAEQKINNILEWNAGNHFVDSDKRTAKGFSWVMNSL